MATINQHCFNCPRSSWNCFVHCNLMTSSTEQAPQTPMKGGEITGPLSHKELERLEAFLHEILPTALHQLCWSRNLPISQHLRIKGMIRTLRKKTLETLDDREAGSIFA